MKRNLFIVLLCFSFFCCNLFTNDTPTEELSYTTKIAWNSKLFSSAFRLHMVDGDSVFFYEQPPESTTENIFALTRLNAETGVKIWRRYLESNNIIYCQPIVIDAYIYVFQEPNIILCFERETGKHKATAGIFDTQNQELTIVDNVSSYQQYLYMGLYNETSKQLSRLDVNAINKSGDPKTEQILSPEIIWEPKSNCRVSIKPVVYNNVVYASTYGGNYFPVELAGFNINTKEKVFYQTFGGPEDGEVPFPEKGGRANNIFIHDDVLYYISWSIAAWDLKNPEEPLYRHVFTWDTPNAKIFSAPGLVQAEYYKENLYFTNGSGNGPEGFRNLHCIDAKTGKLVWNDARSQFSLDSNVIIANGLLYVTQSTGLLVYEPETGKLVGIDKSFYGTDLGRNVLYKDYIICVIKDQPGIGEGRLAAVYVGK